MEEREGAVVVTVERGGAAVTAYGESGAVVVEEREGVMAACGERGAMAVEEREGVATTVRRGCQRRR